MLRHEIADANGPNLAISKEFLQRSVSIQGAIECRGQRLVQDQQIELPLFKVRVF
jgi:hypothetical protein